MDEMRGGISGSTSGSIQVFLSECLVPIVISDRGADSCRSSSLLLQLLLSGAAVSGIVPFVLAVKTYEHLFKL
jgi:hypothetical protein